MHKFTCLYWAWILDASDVVLRIIGGRGYWAHELWKHCSITAFDLLRNIFWWCHLSAHCLSLSLYLSVSRPSTSPLELSHFDSRFVPVHSLCITVGSRYCSFPNWFSIKSMWRHVGWYEKKLDDELTGNWRVKHEWGEKQGLWHVEAAPHAVFLWVNQIHCGGVNPREKH